MNVYSKKEILADALSAEKATTGVYNTMANECKCPELKNTLLNILGQEHNIQFDVFNTMQSEGFYPTPEAQQQKIDEAKQTYAANATNAR